MFDKIIATEQQDYAEITVPVHMADALLLIAQEVDRAQRLHPTPMRSTHEGLGIIQEEFHEFRDEVYADNMQAALKEVKQTGAMCLRYLIDMAHGRKVA